MNYDYEYFKESADYILSKINFRPSIGIVLGSCLGELSDEIENQVIIDYDEIPNFLKSTVKSHAGRLILGQLKGKDVICMSGRFHYYEGYEFEQLVIPIRVFKLLGVETVILTNAAGAINISYNTGDIMLIEDHIKFMGSSPLRGNNFDEFGPRFFDMSNAYDRELREIVKKSAKDLGINLKEGIYFYAEGPQFETPAEIRAMRAMGADAVGMSTVTEVITAIHCNIKVIGLSLISNMAAGVLNNRVTAEEVDIVASQLAEKFKRLVNEIVKKI
ncbi:purine-nucleoside phosphorylase [Peptoniphilus sp. oral taxon 386]|uniref:purine-nucleoside phosphorylase n=1 Tax=Peptoniphilus sp. oral taxon 386 TaxID=652713 RepID=UPI0001DA9C52|nr:purine-nucleoside phosphorylase [Peptoniphilus sp. oral taxon 386]EFI42627.1 purine nucleoside phosphorylase I, inosine and guanosine-specific [Peptoniphilus sp. oral taxon 386 str. F0131]